MVKTKKERLELMIDELYRSMQDSNPYGSNSIRAYVARDKEVFLIEETNRWGWSVYTRVPISDVDEDETIIFVGKECLYGIPERYRVAVGTLGKMDFGEIMASEKKPSYSWLEIIPMPDSPSSPGRMMIRILHHVRGKEVWTSTPRKTSL